jgi:hypothetical protein
MAVRFFLALLLCAHSLRAHDGLELPPPITAAEAWNVITLCRANLEKLTAEGQWSEIPVQAALIMQSARYLRESLGDDPAKAPQREKVQQLENNGLFLVRASMRAEADRAQRNFAGLTASIEETAKDYDPKVINAPVFSCPMCRGIRELDQKTPCFKCGMALVPRSIPASSLYNTPGEPSIALAPTLAQPLIAGQPAAVRIRFTRKKDGAPITPDDLLVVHTERIHLLIIDESLTDYHHEHPLPTDVPGEYAFTFTPRKPGSYRVFADVVPRVSNTQEYPVCDLPAAGKGEPITDRASVNVAEVAGLRFELKWETGGLAVRAKQAVNATITVTTLEGKPFTLLEPVMGTYAHIVGFLEDRKTVLHIHPTGAEPQKPEDRGGPTFHFRFYAPAPGFIRLYGQVQVAGKNIFAPFGLTVE